MRFGSTLLTLDEANEILAVDIPIPEDSVEKWVDPNNRVFAERMMSAKRADRDLVKGMLLESMAKGETGQQAAGRVEDFLTPLSSPLRDAGRRLLNRHTPTPELVPLNDRSGVGSSRLRTLSRTELSRAHGQGTIDAATLNPFVAGVKWNLSASHPESDPCDQNAQNSSRGLPEGVYKPGEVPPYPEHPNCLCFLSQVVTRKISSIVQELLRRERSPLKDSPFFIADDIDEAHVFAREVLGVDADYGDELGIANLTNRAMWDVKNQGGKLPENVRVRDFTEDPRTFAQYDGSIDTVEINTLRKDFYESDAIAKKQFDNDWFAAPDRVGLLHHELGHVDHYKNNARSFVTSMQHRPTGVLKGVTDQVSDYASTDLEEFMAEVFAGRLSGKVYSDEVDTLYDFLRGVKIKGNHIDEALDDLEFGLNHNFLNQFEITDIPIAPARRRLPDELPPPLDLKIVRFTPTRKLEAQFDQDYADELSEIASRRLKQMDNSSEIEDAISRYAEGDGEDVNRWLRANKPPDFTGYSGLPVEDLAYIDRNLEKFLDNLRVPDDMVVYRAFNPQPDNVLWNPELGLEFKNNSYLSTSIWGEWNRTEDFVFALDNFWEEADTRLSIFLPRGTKGGYIDQWSPFEQGELLLQKNADFQVVGGHNRHIQLEHIPTDRPFQITVARAREAVTKTPFVEAKNMDEAREAARKLGVEADYGKKNLRLANLINQSMQEAADAGSKLPGKVKIGKVDPLNFFDRRNTPAAYAPSEDRLYINNQTLHLKAFWRTDLLTKEQELKGWFAVGNRKGIIQHEIGHSNHAKTNFLSNEVSRFTEPLGPLQKTARKVSDYATTDLGEFVAEVHAGKLAGKTYSDDVLNLYDFLLIEKPLDGPVFESVTDWATRATKSLDKPRAPVPVAKAKAKPNILTPEEWVESLTPDEIAALTRYTKEDPTSYDMNHFLRHGVTKRPLSTREMNVIRRDVPHIDSALGKSGLPEDTRVWRYIPTQYISGRKINDEIFDAGFMSTTLNEEVVENLRGFYGSLQIDIPRGEYGGVLRDIEFYSEQRELLLPRDTGLIVREISVPEKGGQELITELISTDRPFVIPVAKAKEEVAGFSKAEVEDLIELNRQRLKRLSDVYRLNPTDEIAAELDQIIRDNDLLEKYSLTLRGPQQFEPPPFTGKRGLDAHDLLYRDSEDWINSLDEFESGALDLYANGPEFEDLNYRLRRQLPLTDDQVDMDRNLWIALDRSKVPEDVEVVRRVQPIKPDHPLYDPNIGDELWEHGYMSTSTSPTFIQGGIIPADRLTVPKLIIRVPEGTKGGYLHRISNFDSEKELLLRKDFELRVVGKDDELITLDVLREEQRLFQGVDLRARAQAQRQGPTTTPKPPPLRKPRYFVDFQELEDYYAKAARLAFTQAQRDIIEANRLAAQKLLGEQIDRRKYVYPGTKDFEDIVDRLPELPTRFQLRRIPPKFRKQVRSRLVRREVAERRNPQLRINREMSIHPERFPFRPEKQLLPHELEELDRLDPLFGKHQQELAEKRFERGQRKDIKYVGPYGMTFTRKEPLSEYYQRLARQQLGGPDPNAALRASPDQVARDAQRKFLYDMFDTIFQIEPIPPRNPIVIRSKKQWDELLKNAQNVPPLSPEPLEPIPVIKPDTSFKLFAGPLVGYTPNPIDRSIPIVLEYVKDKARRTVILFTKKVGPEPIVPVAKARPGGAILRDILAQRDAPEMDTRLKGHTPSGILGNLNRIGVNPQDLVDQFPNFPMVDTLREAEDITREVFGIEDLQFGRGAKLVPGLFTEMMNQVNNGFFEEVMRGNLDLPPNIILADKDEMALYHGAIMESNNLAVFYHRLNAINFNPEANTFWYDDRQAVNLYDSGWMASPDRISTVIHELGHYRHFGNDPDRYRLLRTSDEDEWRMVVDALDIRSRVSQYAATNEVEFVAEMYSGMRSGRVTPYDDDLQELYDWLGGPR